MYLSEKCLPFKLALITQSYGLLDEVQNSCTWHFYEVADVRDEVWERMLFPWCFLFHEPFSGCSPPSIPALSLCLFPSTDLNNETRVFCLLAVPLYIAAVLGSPVSVSQDFTAQRRRRWILFLLSNVTLIESQQARSSGFLSSSSPSIFFPPSPFLRESLHLVVLWALWCGTSCKVSVNNEISTSENKGNKFSSTRGAKTERLCESGETISPMTVNVEQETSPNLCALILGNAEPD